MNYTPKTSTAPPCPGCGSKNQTIKSRGLFAKTVRLECDCGVAGCWETWDPEYTNARRYAAEDGWNKLFTAKDELANASMVQAFSLAFHKSHSHGNDYDGSVRMGLQAALDSTGNVVVFRSSKPPRR